MRPSVNCAEGARTRVWPVERAAAPDGLDGEGCGGLRGPAGPVGRLRVGPQDVEQAGGRRPSRGVAWAAGPGTRAVRNRTRVRILGASAGGCQEPWRALPGAIRAARAACGTLLRTWARWPGRAHPRRDSACRLRLRRRRGVRRGWHLDCSSPCSGMCGSLPAIRACRLRCGSRSRGLPTSPGPVRPGLGALHRSRAVAHRARRVVPRAGSACVARPVRLRASYGLIDHFAVWTQRLRRTV